MNNYCRAHRYINNSLRGDIYNINDIEDNLNFLYYIDEKHRDIYKSIKKYFDILESKCIIPGYLYDEKYINKYKSIMELKIKNIYINTNQELVLLSINIITSIIFLTIICINL